MQDWLNVCKSAEKSHGQISDTEKAFDTMQHPFIKTTNKNKNSQKTLTRGEHPKLDKEHLQKAYK